MKTKNILIKLSVISLPLLSCAQPTINNAEDFSIGTVLKFIACNDSGINAGNAGANQTWDFSNLISLPDTTVQWMIAPASTSFSNTFPGANLVEKSSDGSIVFVNKTTDENNMVGFVDTTSDLAIHYPKELLFAKRPLTYQSAYTRTFRNTYTVNNLNFTGSGISTIHADGYGTLILPNGTHNNVLRVKISIIKTDTLIQFQSVITTTSIVYTWFDGINASSLLRIESTQSGSFSDKKVTYLHSEITSVKENNLRHSIQFYPNPAVDFITILNEDYATVEITDLPGNTIIKETINGKQTLNIQHLSEGSYILHLRNKKGRYATRLIIK